MFKQKSIVALIINLLLIFSVSSRAEDPSMILKNSSVSVPPDSSLYRSKYFKTALSNQACTEAMSVLSRSGANQTRYTQLDALIEAFSVECGISENEPNITFAAVAFKFENEKLLILWDGQSITINDQAEITLELTMPQTFKNIITIRKVDVDSRKENRLLTRVSKKLEEVRDRLQMIYEEGQTRLILSGYAYHDRGTYTPEKLAELNERAWGIGLERVVINKNGNRESVFAMIFLDSHSDPQPAVGYNWQAGFRMTKSMVAYIGASAGLTMRSDMMINDKIPVPIPYIFPTAGLTIGKLDIQSVLIPKLGGGINNGNVLFIFASVPLD